MKKKPLFAMLVAMVISLGMLGQFANDKDSVCVQQLSWGHTWAAQHSDGVDFGVNVFLGGTYATVAGSAITAGFACGVVTPASLVCYGGAALAGL